MTAAAGIDEAYAALAAGRPPVGVPGRAAVIWVEGPDAEGFLHGLLTQDIRALAVGDGAPALLLDERGHIVADLRVRRDGPDSFTLVLDPALAGQVAGLLDRHHFSEDLELLGPEASETVTVPAGAAGRIAGSAVPGLVPGTAEVLVDTAADAIRAAGMTEAPPEALEALRIERGAPRVGVDTGERTLVQEAGLQDRAVSFTKGCYLGQETVARAQHRGRVNRVLRAVLAGAPLPAGAEVLHEGRVVGRVTSAAVSPRVGPVGLAIVRREVPPGSAVNVEGLPGTATVEEVPLP